MPDEGARTHLRRSERVARTREVRDAFLCRAVNSASGHPKEASEILRRVPPSGRQAIGIRWPVSSQPGSTRIGAEAWPMSHKIPYSHALEAPAVARIC